MLAHGLRASLISRGPLFVLPSTLHSHCFTASQAMHSFRHPLHTRARALLRAGVVGDILSVEARTSSARDGFGAERPAREPRVQRAGCSKQRVWGVAKTHGGCEKVHAGGAWSVECEGGRASTREDAAPCRQAFSGRCVSGELHDNSGRLRQEDQPTLQLGNGLLTRAWRGRATLGVKAWRQVLFHLQCSAVNAKCTSSTASSDTTGVWLIRAPAHAFPGACRCWGRRLEVS